jgi:hypothetical protein
MRSASKTKTKTAGVEILFKSSIAGLRSQKLPDVERRDNVTKVPTCGSEEKEVEGLQFADDLVLDFPWKIEESGRQSIVIHRCVVCNR